MEERKIVLEGADNARDLGGLPVKSGARIQKKKLLRSNHLANLTPGDIETLTKEYHLKKIIDLRTETEVKEAGDVIIEGVEWIHIPIFTEKRIGITHERGADQSMTFTLDELPQMEEIYRLLILDEYSRSQLGKVLEVIAGNVQGAVLWHCTEGKDRCGMVSALMELILGVEISDIYNDYLLTNEASEKRSEAMRRMVLEKTKNEQAAEHAASMFLAKREYLDAAIREMERIAGSTSGFLENYFGITEMVRRELQNRFLEEV